MFYTCIVFGNWMEKNKYDIYEVRMKYINFSIIVEDSIIIMSPTIRCFVGMDFNELKRKVKDLDGSIVKVNYSIVA